MSIFQNYHQIDDELQKSAFNAHWQLSSSLTTQHLVSIVAVTNTLMSMNYVSFAAAANKGGKLFVSIYYCIFIDSVFSACNKLPEAKFLVI